MELGSLSSEDPLGRYVSSKKRALKAQQTGNIKYDLFEPRNDEDRLSVDRLDLASDAVMAEIADQNVALRGKPFFGWAVVLVRQASQMGRRVESTPYLDNPYHADIYLNLPSGPERRDVRRQHAYNLARQAVYRPWRRLSGRR